MPLITNAAGAAYYPSEDGTVIDDDTIIAISGASGIAGELEYLTSEADTWAVLSDPDGDQDIGAVVAADADSGYLKQIAGGGKDFRVRLNITTAPSADAPYGFYKNSD